jgi:hypothetical protein
MTLDEARAHIGQGVVYQRPDIPDLPAEDGVITSVGSLLVFVRYSGDGHISGTHPHDLTLLAGIRP